MRGSKIVFLKELTDAEKITILQSILGEQITTEELKKYQELEKEILHELSNSEYYKVLESFSRTIQNRVADIVRYVEFNQGTDARYVTDELMKLMSEIPIRPLRIAFDYIGMKKKT